ncbi:MAG: GAF domain-containing protein [Candidatus Heimdallarchaeota archaeon]
MKIKGKEINEMKIFYDFSKNLQKISSLDDIYKKIISIFTKTLPYDLAILYMFDFTERLLVKEKTGIEVNSEIFSDDPANLDLLKSKFKEPKIYIYNKWNTENELHKLFFKADQIFTVALIPYIAHNHILGFLCIGSKEPYTFTPNEILLLESIVCTTSRFLGYVLINEILSSHNQELRNIAKNMRHDFANDVQSIALSIELLHSTELTEEQSKFVRILGNAKNSAVDKINELRKLKKKFEDEIPFNFGLPL